MSSESAMPDNNPKMPSQRPVKKTSMVKKCLFSITTVLAVLLLIASSLLFTHTGNALLWRQLGHFLPALDGELTEGELLTGWRIRNLRWQDSRVSLQVDEVTLKWQLLNIFSGQLPVELVEVKEGRLTLQPTEAETKQPEPVTNGSDIDIPLDILVEQINLQNIHVAIAGTRVFLETFKASARLQDNRLSIPGILADNLQVALSPVESPAADNRSASPDKQPAETVDFSTITLPEIRLPIPISLKQLTLTNARYQQGTINEALAKLVLSFNWQASHLTGLKLRAEQARADIRLDGDIQLSRHYPLNLNMEATLLDNFDQPELAAIKGEKLSLTASGDLQQLQLQLSTQGAVNTLLKGSIGPLAPNLPVSMALTWPLVQWPLQQSLQSSSQQAAPQFSAANGSIRITGDLNQYQLSLDTSVKVMEQPLTHVTLKSSGDLTQLTIEDLSIGPDSEEHRAAKALKLTGKVSWEDGINGQGQIHLSKLNPQWWLPGIPGTLNGKASTRFAMDSDGWQLAVPELNITGSLLNKPVKATGKLEADNRIRPTTVLPLNLNIHNLHATLGKNRITISGKVAEQLSLQANLDARELDALSPDLGGSLQGNVRLTGSDKYPALWFDFDSPSIGVQQTRINQLRITGELSKNRLAEAIGKATVAVGTLNSGSIQLKQLLLSASGSEQNHQIALTTRGQPVSGELLIKGGWKKPDGKNNSGQWQGQLASANIITPVDNWSLEKPVPVQLNDAGEVSIDNQCWLAKPARLCIDASQFSASHGRTGFRLADFNLANLKPLLPEKLGWNAILSGTGDIQWDGEHPVVHLQMQTTPGAFTSNADKPLVVKYQQLSTEINLNSDDLKAQFTFDSKQLGSAHINLAINNMQSDQTLSGEARLQAMRLNFLQPLIPAINTINGVLSADTRMGGTLKKPLLFGSLKLNDGQLVARQEMVNVSNLTTILNVDGSKGKVSGRMTVGGGEMKLSGYLDWQKMPLSGEIDMKGQDLGISVPGMVRLKASPDLKLTIGEAQTLTGNITIPWARVNIRQLPKQAISPSDDVVIITPGSKETVVHAGPPFAMDVNVVLGRDIKMDAYGLKSGLGGHLRLDLQPDKPLVADGSIQLLNGRYHQFGQDLLIKEGNIIFSGPLTSPYLSVNAVRNPDSIEGDVTVGIQVSGSPARPRFSIYSDPAMAQQEQWSYLLRGRGLDDGDDSSAVQSMLVGFGVSQFGGVVTTLGEKIGLSDVTLNTEGSGDNTQVTIGGTIAPGLRLQYGAGVFNSIAEVKVRYELMPRLYLQAVSGIDQAIDLFYQFKIKTWNAQ